MIPITRKELYLNKIVGNNNYETPEKPITTEEFFFAEILGEAVQAPEPLTRYQMYLAKIAGREIEIPYPKVRLELFLAKACGMDIETPTPITREEIFWSNYTAIVDLEVEGVPPLTYKAIEGALENYRIYGNTVGGESVGDLMESGEHAGEYSVPVTVEGKNLVSSYLVGNDLARYSIALWCEIDFKPNTEYILDFISVAGVQFYTNEHVFGVARYTNMLGGKKSLRIKTISTIDKNQMNQYNANKGWVILKINDVATEDIEISDVQIRLATIEDDTYEPYQAPVTTPIYLPGQIKKVGDEAEYISYSDQKMHRIGAEDIDVTLPALPTLAGTNVLSVGTEVQPSKVYVKYKGERQ